MLPKEGNNAPAHLATQGPELRRFVRQHFLSVRRCLWRLLWRCLRWLRYGLSELSHLLYDLLHRQRQAFQQEEQRRLLWRLLWRVQRLCLWLFLRCSLWRIREKIPPQDEFIRAETMRGVEVQTAGMNRPLEGAAVHVAQAGSGRDGELGHEKASRQR